MEHTKAFNIAIDGPAGAGKSTIARLTAGKLGFVYVDTGAMYRAIALYMLRNGVPATDKEAVASAVRDVTITIRYEEDSQRVLLNGEDVSGLIRTEEVGNTASLVSAVPAVREHLLKLQRELAGSTDVIMDGRDIGTCILPNADVKIFLSASSAVRAKRRYKELTETGETCNLEKIEQDIIKRDEQDANRSIAPLKRAEDAVLIDSSEMTIAEVVGAIFAEAEKKGLKLPEGALEK
mgnify:FL=1